MASRHDAEAKRLPVIRRRTHLVVDLPPAGSLDLMESLP